jgi:hypothetical protein
MSAARPALTAPYVLEYTYRRSVGPVLGEFLAGLRDARVLGARTAGGRTTRTRATPRWASSTLDKAEK